MFLNGIPSYLNQHQSPWGKDTELEEEDLKPNGILTETYLKTSPPELTWDQMPKLGLSYISHVEAPPFTAVQEETKQ